MAREDVEKKIEFVRRTGKTTLDLSNSGLSEVPSGIESLTQLVDLDLGGNQLTTLPEWIGDLSRLKTLDVSFNALTSLPTSIGHLQLLSQLNLSRNRLTALPEAIGRLSRLRQLIVADNRLLSLPHTIGRLLELQELWVQENELAGLPVEIGALLNLRTLSLSVHDAFVLPGSVARLVNLRTLYLHGSPLTEVPASVKRFPGLRTLSLSGALVLPEWLGELQSLNTLSVHGSVTRLPDSIGDLPQLSNLLLANNELAALPASVARLENLRTLNLENNRIKDLPPSLGALERLSAIDLKGNPLLPALSSAYRKGIDELKAYLRSLANAKPLYEAKLLVVGEGGVGKTTLLKALSGREPRAHEPTTHGVSIDIHSVHLPHPEKTNVAIQFNAWDFGGQEVYRVTHQFFFSRRSIYLVVWEPRMGVQQCQVEDWLRLIRLRVGDDARVIIVSTHAKTGQRIARIDKSDFLRDYGTMIVDFVEIDSLVDDPETNEKFGVAALKQRIATAAKDLEQMGMPFNVRWKEARDESLEHGKKRPHVSYADFRAICESHGLDDTDTRTLAGLMHDLGYIVYYGADERLRNDVVLQPEWLTKAIGFVLEDPVTQNREGILPDAHLQDVWLHHRFTGEPTYDPALYPFFLRLMEQYDVSYRLEDGTASLVAQHVPQVRPPLPWLPEDEPTADRRRLAMVCVMDESPPGLIPWMIVRTHDYAVERETHRLHWDKGMFLRNRRHGEALVELRDRELHIYAEAIWPWYFMNIVQQTLTKLIVDNWPGLEGRYRFTVPCRSDGCRGRFEIDALRQFHAEGDTTIRCQACRGQQPILELLYGFEDEEPRAQLARIENKLDMLPQEIESRIANAVMILMGAMANEAKDGPRLFTIHGLGKSGRSYRLRLWCEAPNCEHPLIGEEAGVYEFETSPEWLRQVAPYAGLVAFLLKTLLPMVTPAVDLMFGAKTIEQLGVGDHLALMKELAGTLSGELAITGAHRLREGMLNGDERSGLLALHSLLRELDPHHARIGLHRVPTYTGDYLWLCGTHYELSQPKIPDRIA